MLSNYFFSILVHATDAHELHIAVLKSLFTGISSMQYIHKFLIFNFFSHNFLVKYQYLQLNEEVLLFI